MNTDWQLGHIEKQGDEKCILDTLAFALNLHALEFFLCGYFIDEDSLAINLRTFEPLTPEVQNRVHIFANAVASLYVVPVSVNVHTVAEVISATPQTRE